MPATVILGAQWGDEGKGKLVDRLAEQATWVARFQGGNNAGHTVVLGDQVLKFHLLPSGITRKECHLVLGDGMVIDPWVLDKELTGWMETLQAKSAHQRGMLHPVLVDVGCDCPIHSSGGLPCPWLSLPRPCCC